MLAPHGLLESAWLADTQQQHFGDRSACLCKPFLPFYVIPVPTVKKIYSRPRCLAFSDFLSTSVIPCLSWMSCHVSVAL